MKIRTIDSLSGSHIGLVNNLPARWHGSFTGDYRLTDEGESFLGYTGRVHISHKGRWQEIGAYPWLVIGTKPWIDASRAS